MTGQILKSLLWATHRGDITRALITHDGSKTIVERGRVAGFTRRSSVENLGFTYYEYGFFHGEKFYKSTHQQRGAEGIIIDPDVPTLLNNKCIVECQPYTVDVEDTEITHIYAKYFTNDYQYTLEYFPNYAELYVFERDFEGRRTAPYFRYMNERHETDSHDYYLLGRPDFVNKPEQIFQYSLLCDINFEAYARCLPLMDVFAESVLMEIYDTNPTELKLVESVNITSHM